MLNYVIEKSVELQEFEAWSGGLDRLNAIIKLDKVEEAEELLVGMLEGYEDVTDTTINDILWFEMDDLIEQWEEEAEEESTMGYKVGDKVVIRKGLVVGETYGGYYWESRKDYLKDEDYLVVEEVCGDGDYLINGWYITEKMIQGLYIGK